MVIVIGYRLYIGLVIGYTEVPMDYMSREGIEVVEK